MNTAIDPRELKKIRTSFRSAGEDRPPVQRFVFTVLLPVQIVLRIRIRDDFFRIFDSGFRTSFRSAGEDRPPVPVQIVFRIRDNFFRIFDSGFRTRFRSAGEDRPPVQRFVFSVLLPVQIVLRIRDDFFQVLDSGPRISDSGSRILDSGFRIPDFGFRIQFKIMKSIRYRYRIEIFPFLKNENDEKINFEWKMPSIMTYRTLLLPENNVHFAPVFFVLFWSDPDPGNRDNHPESATLGTRRNIGIMAWIPIPVLYIEFQDTGNKKSSTFWSAEE
jgi:hypothetical protein